MSPEEQPSENQFVRLPPPPLDYSPRTLWRFLRKNKMLNRHYVPYIYRLAKYKLKYGKRLQLDGMAFICKGVKFEIGPEATVSLGRWSWLGDDTKVRCHEGTIIIGAKSVLGQECTLSCYERVQIGRECIIADRTMFIDFDHAVMMIEDPIRKQGTYMRPVTIGHNVWMGYGACVLRGVTLGNNSILGTLSVATRDIPENAVAAGSPARVIRMRETPTRLHWVD